MAVQALRGPRARPGGIGRGWYVPICYAQDSLGCARTTRETAAGGYRVVCDGIVGPWFLEPFRAAAAGADLSLHYVVLRPDESTRTSPPASCARAWRTAGSCLPPGGSCQTATANSGLIPQNAEPF